MKKTIRVNEKFMNELNDVDRALKKKGLVLDQSKIIRYVFYQGIEKLKQEEKKELR